MKLTSAIVLTLLAGSSITAVNEAVDISVTSGDLENAEGLYSCAYFPLCDFDIYNPILQPKDKTIDTQDKDKDSKVA